MKQFQNVLKSTDFGLLEVLLDDKIFASKRSNDVQLEKDTDTPVNTTIVIHDSDSESSAPSAEELGEGEEDFSEEVTDIESASDDEEGEEDDVDEYEHSGDEF